jgi:hypothetical protein
VQTAWLALLVSSVGHAAKKAVICVRMRDWEHALVAELAQRLVRVDETSADEGVEAPGEKAVVIFVNVERQLLRVGSVLSAVKNVEQDWVIPEGMRGFGVLVA